ncbi:MAG: YraN family protein [bacterium]|nr:YraN family protein [bacterium]
MKNNFHNQSIGKVGEDLAVTYLEENHYRIIDRNFNTKVGEIDIIAIKNDIIYCIEVKTRSSTMYGQPYEAINYKKLNRMKHTALIYAKQSNYQGELKLLLVSIIGKNCSLLEIE